MAGFARPGGRCRRGAHRALQWWVMLGNILDGDRAGVGALTAEIRLRHQADDRGVLRQLSGSPLLDLCHHLHSELGTQAGVN